MLVAARLAFTLKPKRSGSGMTVLSRHIVETHEGTEFTRNERSQSSQLAYYCGPILAENREI